MKDTLKQFFHAHKSNRLLSGLVQVYRFIRDLALSTIAGFRLIKWKFPTKDHSRPIRICFVYQDPNCWNKSKALYEYFLADSRFHVSLLCIPDPFDKDTGSTYRFFQQNGYNGIDARVGEGPWDTQESLGDWFDLASLKPDYVFYHQPYDAYLPEIYRSHIVAKYARICLTPYGFALTKELLPCMVKSFCWNVYRMYSVSETEREYNQARFPISHKLGLRKSCYFSPLVFADFFQQREEKSPSWDFSHNTFRAIWTPRWTTDEVLGGSNFFRYKDFLPQYAKEHPEIDLLFRPHPMAFSNFVRSGQMTQEEVDEYIDQCNTLPNCALDTQKSYGATFWQSDVLITDISAIIVEYFVTGKPIIFCKTEKSSSTFLDFFQKILSACYIANNKDDLEGYLKQLQAGIDPLKPKREEQILSLFGENPCQAPVKIATDILKDFQKA